MNNAALMTSEPSFPTDVNMNEAPVSENVAEKYKKHLSSFTQARVDTGLNEGTENVLIWQDYNRKLRGREEELQWWYGKIVDIEKDSIEATVQDLSGRFSNVSFDKNTVSPDDMDLLFIGNTFTYSVSRIDKPNGQRIHESRFSLSSKRAWLKDYEKKASDLLNDVFPERLLNL